MTEWFEERMLRADVMWFCIRDCVDERSVLLLWALLADLPPALFFDLTDSALPMPSLLPPPVRLPPEISLCPRATGRLTRQQMVTSLACEVPCRRLS